MPMEKEQIIKTILDVSNEMGLPIETKVKTEKWKADVVVDYGKYKVAFTVNKTSQKVKEFYQAMREERVCGCWLRIPSKLGGFWNHELPVFNVEEDNDIQVLLNGEYYSTKNDKLKIQDFISLIIQGKIRWLKESKAKYVDISFGKNKCWRCHRESDVYAIYQVISEDGIRLDHNMADIDFTFLPSVVRGALKYVKEHPERKIIMGTIKKRYSKTVRDSYMSFGCAFCDALFGNFYLRHPDIGDYDFEEQTVFDIDEFEKNLVRIELDNEIMLPARRWGVQKD